MTRVLVVDDHPLWRDAVARDLADAGCTVVGTAGDGDQALRVAAATRPGLVLLDLQLPGRSGVDVTRALCSGPPPVPYVLVLSASGEQRDVLDAMKAGATGYLTKSATREELLAAVDRAGRGEPVFTPGLAGLVLGEFRQLASGTPERPVLTPRETEVLRLVATGRSYRQIAEQLVVSHRTVQNHVQNILGKLQLDNRVQLTRYAIEHGLDDVR
ncbi:response regulator [Jiangella alkaliphila]|uniref:DNA-binding response regulator, NarL/FixJ family, contains REC and HTH domains n=1 Tax=Jiangella alkaliphila TaxID=419479 RepID=A0A1H2HB36_9ACTN|nr:response regulator transcription factor [Jiangella alkaliphila]SDU29002.1 DNA-binding response regulator, NarL/FixJ family, contains REC and HTH domains [Jiangella alkaliphila]